MVMIEDYDYSRTTAVQCSMDGAGVRGGSDGGRGDGGRGDDGELVSFVRVVMCSGHVL